jgi:hypothetical protein
MPELGIKWDEGRCKNFIAEQRAINQSEVVLTLCEMLEQALNNQVFRIRQINTVPMEDIQRAVREVRFELDSAYTELDSLERLFENGGKT